MNHSQRSEITPIIRNVNCLKKGRNSEHKTIMLSLCNSLQGPTQIKVILTTSRSRNKSKVGDIHTKTTN